MAEQPRLVDILTPEKFERIERAFRRHFKLGLETTGPGRRAGGGTVQRGLPAGVLPARAAGPRRAAAVRRRTAAGGRDRRRDRAILHHDLPRGDRAGLRAGGGSRHRARRDLLRQMPLGAADAKPRRGRREPAATESPIEATGDRRGPAASCPWCGAGRSTARRSSSSTCSTRSADSTPG